MNPRYWSPKLNNYHYLAILVSQIFFKSRNGRTPPHVIIWVQKSPGDSEELPG